MIEAGAVLYLVGAAITAWAFVRYSPPQTMFLDVFFAVAVAAWPLLWLWAWLMAMGGRDWREGP